ncbi:acetate/propionate family kinase [Roseinatronobacter alkalisoli]|uniref:Acetate kinase n=1 Tax=Roseinatronobacter alkalisoli TaxID=3028235 RepID=A0ABT5T5K1_9RHOB|nr:acetate/propionate family kinase [Roseinatronobacter sp. HJB301]MDD7970395.1 acetate/propionate family kinase [Roseinatronobacter sp. HJB301]
MRIIVFNAGSSSLKFGVFDLDAAMTLNQAQQLYKGSFDRFGPDGCDFRHGAHTERAPHRSLSDATRAVPALLQQAGISGIDAVGHRIAHGGARFDAATLLDDTTLAQIAALTPLAPLHNPANLEAVDVARQVWPDLPQWAVFDTAFHLSNPARASTYAVPKAWRDTGLRRFGFHGTSHKYVAQRAAEVLGHPLRDLRLISLHLGNGASACAIAGGVSIDSSMGMTPMEGLVMGTRSGDVDPGLFGYLQREMGLDIAEIEDGLNRHSGLLGLTGSSDMRDVEARAAQGDSDAQLAIHIYAYRARKYIGAYAAAMGGLDALVFTGGIGENSPSMRRRICDGLGFMGLLLDHDRNMAVELTARAAPQIQAYGARVNVLVTETAEQLMIARDVAVAMARPSCQSTRIPVAVSARHVHLCRKAVDALFGPSYELTPDKPLRQQGHWAARERVNLHGPKGDIANVAILGPLRDRTQIEVSRTDSFALGLDAPVRQSGNLDGTPIIRLSGPAGEFDSDGLIIAARHIHMSAQDAARMKLRNGDMADVTLDATGRDLTFTRVLVRVTDNAFTEMHIDTDEANAAGIRGEGDGHICAAASMMPTRDE